MPKSLTELAADIVAVQALKSKMTPAEVQEALKKVYGTLAQMKTNEGAGGHLALHEDKSEPIPDALTKLQEHPKRSIRQNSVLCLECGAEFKQITAKHTQTHGLTPKEYKKKWGFKSGESLASKALSSKRRETAERLGMADRLVVARQKRAEKIAVSKAPDALEQLAKYPDGKPVSEELAQLQRNPLRSIRKNEIICLECGDAFKMMTKVHLETHGMDADDYRRKWDLGKRQSLSSTGLSERRRATAEKHGLGDRLVAAREKSLAEKVQAEKEKAEFKPSVVRRKKGE